MAWVHVCVCVEVLFLEVICLSLFLLHCFPRLYFLLYHFCFLIPEGIVYLYYFFLLKGFFKQARLHFAVNKRYVKRPKPDHQPWLSSQPTGLCTKGVERQTKKYAASLCPCVLKSFNTLTCVEGNEFHGDTFPHSS